MRTVKYVRNGKVATALEVTLEELESISKTCGFVSISTHDHNDLISLKEEGKIKDNDIVGAIFGDIGNVLNSLDEKYEGEIVSNPDCWFVNKNFLEKNYKSIDSLFGFWEIMPLLKTRQVIKAARIGWNGNKRPGDEEFKIRMWVTYIPSSTVKVKEGSPYHEAGLRGELEIKGHFDLYTPGGYMQPGWVASQEDLVSDDWIIIP
jgi:hypothetical protein